MIKVQALSGGYAGKKVLKNLSFSVEKGELFGILGPNGSGKTTLLKLLSGMLKAKHGSITVLGKPLESYSAKALAKLMAVLPQLSTDSFAYTVKETVSLGRYAHQKRLFHSWSFDDEKIVQEAMAQTGVQQFQHQHLQTLSGGEKQRVFLAQALAQQPEILLLDEPTNHLDLSYQKELLELLKKWTKTRNLTVVSIFHDLNIAALYCDRLLLLHNGEMEMIHHPNEVLKEGPVQAVYQTNIKIIPHPCISKPQMMFVPDEQSREQPILLLDERYLQQTKEMIVFHTPIFLKTISSALVGSGIGWRHTFVNHSVEKNNHDPHSQQEKAVFFTEKGFLATETVGMMTTAKLRHVFHQLFKGDGFSVFMVAIAGDEQHTDRKEAGGMNLWVFVNGNLTDEALVQSIVTATEAKAKILRELEIEEKITAAATDSLLVAAAQNGKQFNEASASTPLGKLIAHGVKASIKAAIFSRS
ncbi:ATP-binding cassette domain-containing protein [Bacillus chungangensis]|uniref:Iron complex transport system ATP-binding protein n=1 Tax=Bacillus chungangensis TaxID=587633 RepID=A0ABT9WWD2_9BACI|nr:ATP-binding cassette domain-containing protein [Bacillus chungangensis]MDQ0177522.1 iron complex transport system ATP-binding protein [Bacillus chungangensis]